jgi:hypothetical protein
VRRHVTLAVGNGFVVAKACGATTTALFSLVEASRVFALGIALERRERGEVLSCCRGGCRRVLPWLAALSIWLQMFRSALCGLDESVGAANNRLVSNMLVAVCASALLQRW